MENARAYIRLSRFRADDMDKLGPQVQLEKARNACQLKGWNFDEEASIANQDLDVSGYSTKWRDRPGLWALYLDAKAGKFNRLVIHAIDRLGRNAPDTLDAWSAFESVGVSIFAVRDGLDGSTDTGRLLRTIMAGVAEMESANASARITANCEARARAGRLHGGRLPAWLMRDEEGLIVVNEQVASAIRYAVMLRIEGNSYTAITRKLNGLGYRTPSGTRFQKSWIVKIFTWDWIETMAGTAFSRRRGRYAMDPRTKRKYSRGEPIPIPNGFPRIISEVERKMLLEVATAKCSEGLIRNRASERWLLNGVFHCAICGSRMGVHSRNRKVGGTRRTYFCESHNDDPTQMSHPLSRVDGSMVELAVILAVNPLYNLIAKEDESSEFSAPKLRSQVEVNREITRLVGLYSKGTIAEEILDAKLRTLNDELSAIVNLAAIEVSSANKSPKMTSKLELRKWLQKFGIEIKYPVFVSGENYKANWRSQVASPIPFVEIKMGNAVSLLSPVFRNGVRERRKIKEKSKMNSSFGYWSKYNSVYNVSPERVSMVEVCVTPEMAELAK